VIGGAIASRMISAAILAASVIVPAHAVDAGTGIDFGQNRIGVAPEDFDFAITGAGPLGQWIVVRDVTATCGIALEQSSDDFTEDRYRLAIYQPLSLKNLAASVHLKVMKGAMQTAGIAFRLVDADNYYVATANALEDRVDLARVQDGKKQRIGGTDADLIPDHWQVLGVLAENDRFSVYLDGRPLFTVSDHTFLKEGRIGLWTEEDNVTRFDQLEITALPWSEER
jgi:hypothetical protein